MSDAAETFGNALIMWQQAAQSQNLTGMLDASAMMQLAQRQNGEPNANVMAFLALINYDISVMYANSSVRNSEKEYKKFKSLATQNADTAIGMDPINFRARLVKALQAADEIRVTNFGARDLVENPFGAQGWFKMLGNLGQAGVATAQAQASQSAFANKLGELISAYTVTFGDFYQDAEEFLFCTDFMFRLADFCREHHIVSAKEASIYAAITAVNLEDLTYEGYEEEAVVEVKKAIAQMRSLATARSMSR